MYPIITYESHTYGKGHFFAVPTVVVLSRARVMICGVLLYVRAILVIVRVVTRKERAGREGDANVCSSQLEVKCVCVCGVR